MSYESIIRYLNTDLDLVAPIPLTDLVESLESRCVIPISVDQGKDGLWYSTLESAKWEQTEPESTVIEILTAIDSLSAEVLKVWNACTKREFNIGYECGDEPRSFTQRISNDTLRRMAECGSTLALTLYPFHPDPPSIDERDENQD
jgi:hypothetical protein